MWEKEKLLDMIIFYFSHKVFKKDLHWRHVKTRACLGKGLNFLTKVSHVPANAFKWWQANKSSPSQWSRSIKSIFLGVQKWLYTEVEWYLGMERIYYFSNGKKFRPTRTAQADMSWYYLLMRFVVLPLFKSSCLSVAICWTVSLSCIEFLSDL